MDWSRTGMQVAIVIEKLLLSFFSRVEDSPNSDLVVFDDLVEMNCVLKYLIDEFPDQATTKYAIGLQSPDDYKGNKVFNIKVGKVKLNYKGVYEWRVRPKDLTPTFTNWANGYPTDQKCVSMTVGIGASQNGRWTDGHCTTETTLFAICEKKIR